MPGVVARAECGVVLALALAACLTLTACATNRTTLLAPTTASGSHAAAPCRGPETASGLARRLGLCHADADTHVLLSDSTTRVRIWKDSEEVSVAGRTARMSERSRRQGRSLIVPACTAQYVEASIRQSRTMLLAHDSSRRPAVRPALPILPMPCARPERPAAAPIRAPDPVVAATPKLPAADRGWEPRGVSPRAWRWIVVHHSDDTRGNLQKYDRIHRCNNGWDECGYHFVIGNGSQSGDGQIEVGSRWFKQKHGAHAKTPDNRFNDFGVGICLVGDFEDCGRPTRAQMDALVRLCRWLMARFSIRAEDVVRHEDCKPTACPGRLFPWAELRRRLASPSL